ncbi:MULTISPECIES: DUF134 domain-containing protein [Pseudovibrio]|uniref:DUF134 domain-containing protein n=1 Tax=Stappiaceae TaxID=2821832 RepID=UPI002365C21E|nr:MULTISPECIES: DUF134 domain-containing protein [Pseudovibrio]MDD7910789.1 DUF134 domain-containing protein [Pseudovibrio exalbescens]MDX5593503.1 DUF134 domain-containing protein [Pseudovibrio sp. SPO723]
MPRPRKMRRIQEETRVRFYKPQGIPMRELRAVVLPEDGLEALRLADAEGLEQATAAELMGISRPTFSRLVSHARTTVATALTEGLALKIEGGEVEILEGTGLIEDEDNGHCRRMRRRRGFCGRASLVTEEVEPVHARESDL